MQSQMPEKSDSRSLESEYEVRLLERLIYHRGTEEWPSG